MNTNLVLFSFMGKTIQAIAAARVLWDRGEVRRVLVEQLTDRSMIKERKRQEYSVVAARKLQVARQLASSLPQKPWDRFYFT